MANSDKQAQKDQYKYLEGFVEIKGGSFKDYQKMFCVIYECTMTYYDHKLCGRERETEKPLESVTLVPKCKINVEEFKVHAKGLQGTMSEIKLRFTGSDERDKWYLRMYTLAFHQLPEHIPLMPGQILIAKDILALERNRLFPETAGEPDFAPPPIPSSPHPPGTAGPWDPFQLYPVGTPSNVSFPPPWYFGKIPRSHAEEILKNNHRFGDLLVRGSESTSGPGEFSLSVRQTSRDASVVVRHYKLRRIRHHGYKLDIDEEHSPRGSVYELLQFFIDKSGGNLKLFETQDPKQLKMPDNLYENRFSEVFVGDPESGELGRHGIFQQGSFNHRQPIHVTGMDDEQYLSPNDMANGRASSFTDGGYMGPSHSYENTCRRPVTIPEEEHQVRPALPPTKQNKKSLKKSKSRRNSTN